MLKKLSTDTLKQRCHLFHLLSSLNCPQHIIFGLTGLVAGYIPDVPSRVKTQVQRENQMAFTKLRQQRNNEKEKKKKTEDIVQVSYASVCRMAN